MEFKGVPGTVNFDVKVKLEEKERKSQLVTVGFNLLLGTKPSVVKFEVAGVATLTGKDDDIRKMLEVDPETKVPYLFQKVYQSAFEAMYLMSTILKAPAPPSDLLYAPRQGPVEGVSVEVGAEAGQAAETAPAEKVSEEKPEASATAK